MLIETPRNTLEERKKWTELLFETFRIPSICLGNSASLSLFASGRTTGLVTECGAGITSTVPVFEGLALSYASISSDYGGQDITTNLRKSFLENNILIDMADTLIIKEKMAYTNMNNSIYNINQQKSKKMNFSLPDGQEITIDNNILYDCIEPLFITKTTNINSNNYNNVSKIGLIDQIYNSIYLCDESIRRDLMSNIILSGGTSMIPGM